MKLLENYKNGNYRVAIFDDGTKIRMLNKGETEYKPEFPENIDCCISKRCSIGCEYCYEDCTPDKFDFDLNSARVKNFIKQLKPGTEIAIGGGALSEIATLKLSNFLQQLYQKGVIASITINSKELLRKPFKKYLNSKFLFPNFIHGLGISYNSDERCKEEMLEMKKKHPKSVVIHTIVGITTAEDFQWLADNHFKVLVLGYKMKGRGLVYFNEKEKENTKWVEENILSLRKKFNSLSFDCLAVEQLNIKSKVDEKTWNDFYMGDDGSFTMYVDLTEYKFAKSSTESDYNKHYFNFAGDNLKDMFRIIKKENTKE